MVHAHSFLGTFDKWCDKDTQFFTTPLLFIHRAQACLYLWLCIISFSDANSHIWKYSLTVRQMSILYCKTLPVCFLIPNDSNSEKHQEIVPS